MILQETFSSLLHDKAHWQFELFVGLIETIVIDVVFGFIIWGLILKPYWKRRKREIIREEHKRHNIKEKHN